jgi:hypothetical protein
LAARSRFLVMTAFAVMSSGCLVGSLHPIYDDKSIEFAEALIGTWANAETEVSATITRGEWRSYQIAFTDRFGTTTFVGHLTSIRRARFLNLLPADGLDKPAFVVATNGFLQVEIQGDGLRLREPDYGEILKRAKAGKLGTAAVTDVKQNVLLTAASAKLRLWLAAAVKDEMLWAEWKTFTRSAP